MEQSVNSNKFTWKVDIKIACACLCLCKLMLVIENDIV